MATDSKLIHNQRKSQFIQLPPPRHIDMHPLASPSSTRSASCGGSVRGGNMHAAPGFGMCTPSTRTGDRTPTNTTPRRSPGGSTKARNRVPEYGSAGRVLPKGALESPFYDAALDDDPYLSNPDQEVRESAGFRALAKENADLKKKLGRSRARSQDRIVKIERERDAFSAESAALSRECESLRSLFILQQQQQIAFWTGPFMEMIAPVDGSNGFSTSRSRQDLVDAMSPSVEETLKPVAAVIDLQTDCKPVPPMPEIATPHCGARNPSTKDSEAVGAECVRNLRRERDYWRIVAMELKQQGLPDSACALPRNSRKSSRQGSTTNSTSQSQHEGSEASRAPWSCSDSGSELSANSMHSRRNIGT